MHLSTHPTSYPTRYQEIAAKLEQELRQHYRCGDYLPAEQQLAARFEVNRHTLRRAIDQLVEKGWVQRRQGVGVLVLTRPFDYPLNAQARFSQNLLDQGSHPTSEKLLSVLRPASGHVADALGITEGENVIHLRTLRRVNGVALCLIDHYFADLTLWPTLQRFDSGSLHDFLREQTGIALRRSQTRISARRAQAKECQRLEIPNMSPLLCVRTLNHRDGESSPAAYSVSLTRADMIEFTMEHRMHADTATRQHWMSILAHSQPAELAARLKALNITADYEVIRAAETGLVQIQARMGGTGERFFAGDATLTRATVRLTDGTLGYSWVLGRDKQHAERCALIDALMQQTRHFQNLSETLIAPLDADRMARIAARQAEVNASRVDFFTMVRGDNA